MLHDFSQEQQLKIASLTQTATFPSLSVTEKLIYTAHSHTQSDTQLHRKHTIHRTTQHDETSDRIKPNTDTHASISLTQTAGRGTGGRAEARLEGMKQIKETQKACRG